MYQYPSKDDKRRQPSKAARRKVREAFDQDALIDLCVRQDFSDYAEYVELTPSQTGRKRFYWFQDNGSDILAIAHLDTVQKDRFCTVTETAAGPVAFSGGLDDRLGVYVILDLLPRLGITVDWLLTTDEEMGQSTAEDFYTTKEYNWMFQFDRGGTDVVMYDYETKKLCDLVEESGARVGMGSYSDICNLDFLGCAGFNWGVGYEDYHSARSHAYLDDTFRMVARFVKFYYANYDTMFPYSCTWLPYNKDTKDAWEDIDDDEATYRQLVSEREAELQSEYDAVLEAEEYSPSYTLMQDKSKELRDWFEDKKRESSNVASDTLE